jgi:hypothetical protein
MKSVSKTWKESRAILTAAVCLLASTSYAANTTTLTNGVAVSGLSGASGSEALYRIDVPAGQDSLKISTTGGTGDVDLYVRWNAPPTTITYDYRPYKVGNEETVDVNNPAAGSWYILLRGYSGYSGVTLKATYAAALSVKPLTNGVAATGISGGANMALYYSIEVPAGQTKLEIAMSGGTGDADLYVKRGSLPTTTSYDYRPYLTGNNETVSVNAPAAGTWYIMIRGYSAFSGITLLASYGGGGGTEIPQLEDGVPITNISGKAGSEKTYRIDLPAGVNTLKIEMSGGTGDADLYVKLKAPPTTTDYDYRPFLAGNDESVTIDSPAPGTWFVMIRGYTDFAGITLKATWANVTTLQNGVPVTNLSGALGSERYFKIDVPAGTNYIQFAISGGTGNADMYLRQGARPTTSSYGYRPSDSVGGNNESVSFTGEDLAGTWYILIKAAKAYDGLTLLVKYSGSGGGTPGVVTLANGVPVTNISGSAGEEKFYKIDVPAGQAKLEIRMSGGTGDADLYVKKGAKPTTSDYDYRPYLIGNDESVAIDNPSSGTWYIMIRGYQPFAGITLVATYGGGTTPEPVTTLQNGVAVTGLKGTAGSESFFKISVPAGQATLVVAMSGGTGDVDLYVKKGAKPTTSDWDYRPYLTGNNETVTINNPAAATYYIMLKGYTAFDGVTLKATYTPAAEPVPSLTNGVPVTGLSGASGSEKFYKIDVPAAQDFLIIEISGGTGDVDLYVKKGAKPTTTSWDYRPYLIGSNEIVDVANPAAGTWYIMLRGYQAYTGLTLTATYGTEHVPPPATGNNFASDPDCVAVWRLEPDQLTTDSIGTNTLMNINVIAETSDYKEGMGCARFRLTGGVSAGQNYLSIADNKLAPSFPGKDNTSNKRFTICFWTKFKSIPNAVNEWPLVTKSNPPLSQASYLIKCGPGGNITLEIGSTGGTLQKLTHATATSADVWYHVAVTFDNVSHTGTISVWDSQTQALLGMDAQRTDFATMSVSPAAFVIGGVDNVWYMNLDGLMDEVVVFKDILTPSEIAQIRAGTYGNLKK